jgi:bifunctional non-homologous end joining protein LigD
MKSSTKTSAGRTKNSGKAAAKGGELDAYRLKRDPSRTNEPFASERIGSSSPNMTAAFVVHLHDARRRHYDLRLQVGGTLQSFAVPRGPSLDPREKRLAVHTEDHPLEYMDFEDVIPEGNYGAGAMIAWDMGRVRYLEPPVEGLAKGKLDFVLSGYKLLGRYALVHTGDRKGRAPDEKNQWLLIKKEDAHSSPDRNIIEELPESVLSGLTVEQLFKKGDVTEAIALLAAKLGGKPGDFDARRAVPMLCDTDGGRLDDPDRYYELKLDGVRLLADRRGDDVALVYRSQRIMTASYPEVARAVRALPFSRLVLDGEVVAFDDAGRPNFQRLGRRMHLTRPHDVQHAAAEVPVVYVVFDVLQIGDRDVRGLPLGARKELLSRIAPRRGPVRWLDHMEGDGRPLYDLCGHMGLEGVVSKRISSPYRAGPDRTDDWIKIKRDREADFVVTGWVEGKGNRKTLGALEVASYVDGKCVLRGRVGSGLEERTIRILRERLAPLEVDAPTAVGEPIGSGTRHFVKPEIVVNVSFGGFTEDAHLRHPVFRGLRDDVAPTSCTTAPAEIGPDEPPPEPAPSREERPAAPAPGKRVRVSNRDKVFWPDEGYTKGELIDYYLSIAPVLLPFLEKRPIVLVRYPDGIKGKSFYQWNVPQGTPSWIHTLHLQADEDGHQKHTFLVSDADGLAHVINLGCIPIHVLPYRSTSMDQCDYFVVDFDLGPRSLSDAVTLALSLKEILTEIGLQGFPKTSGQSGLHVLVPLGPGVSFDVGKTMVELVGRILQIRHPDLSTMERRVSGRGDRVFIDTGQTGRSRTIVAPYSVRAHPGATVSLPIRWEDVHRALDPREFSMFAVPARVAERGDALAGFFDVAPDIPSVVERLGRKLGT